jgi:hypothetical protein
MLGIFFNFANFQGKISKISPITELKRRTLLITYKSPSPKKNEKQRRG